MSDDWTKAYNQLKDTRNLLRKSKLAVKAALRNNPSASEARDLEDMKVELERRLAIVRKRMIALVDQNTVSPPDPTVVGEIAALTAEVETATNASIAASQAISVATRALKLAAKVAA